jgi:putative ABC transport system permease protein
MADSNRQNGLSLRALVERGLRHHWRMHRSVAVAVAVAGAVLTGALLVGDSMRGSLRSLFLDQLGRIDEVLLTDRFFRAELADELQADPQLREFFSDAVGVIYMPATLENPRAGSGLRAGNVSVIGCDEKFWSLGRGGPAHAPDKGEIVLNAPLAAEIGVRAGDEVLVRIGSASQIPPDSPLGRKTETVRTRRLKVADVIPAEGLGRFALHPSQQMPRDAFVATSTLQDMLEQPGKINGIFVAGNSPDEPAEAHDALQACIKPTLADYGIQVDVHKLGYAQCTSNRMLLEPAAVKAIHGAFANRHPRDVMTYLANTIASGKREIPYSTITAIDFATEPPLGPFKSREGEAIAPLRDNEIVLNTWAADELNVKPGAEIEIKYFEPESTHGRVLEKSAKFHLAAIVPLDGLAADPDLTPQLPGVTDRLTIGDWDAPFPFDATRVRNVDEKYWDEHRTTPKAFISLAAGQKLWGSRFGETTAVRFEPPPGAGATNLSIQLKFDPATMGFEFLPLRRIGLAAATGTTSFDALFLGFSFFIMISALALVALLFRLGIEQRAEEVGILRALGLRNRRVAAVMAGEGLVVATAGAVAGAVGGVIYAWIMLIGLTTWWVGATGTPLLHLYVTATSLIIGIASTVLVSMAAIVWVLWRLDHVAVRALLARQTETGPEPAARSARRSRAAAIILFVTALLLGGLATQLGSAAAQAGAFFATGALVLATGLTWIWSRLRTGSTMSLRGVGTLPIARLAMRSGARNPTRSTLSIGLIAAASFLIVALSAFRLDPDRESRGRTSGSGGYDLVAQSDQPIYQDLNSPEGRAEAGFPAQDESLLAKCSIMPIRVRRGDDASCLNLYQATQPRVLGVPQALLERGGFAWASSLASLPEEEADPWLLLDQKLPHDTDGTTVLPAVLDFNTATYSLHKSLGDTIDMDDGLNQPVRLKIVGLMSNSIFQGDLLLSETTFLAHFPLVSGYRFFLIDTDDQPADRVRLSLESALGDCGFDAERSAERLAAFFAVQNTYLSTFQSLGGLGLLLGTFGLAAVQLRSIIQRRGELALLRAAGFRRALLARLVMIENGMLLLVGLSVGVVAALVAVLPHWLGGGASVPWLSLVVTLGLVLVVGLSAGMLAVRATLRAPLVPALREE